MSIIVNLDVMMAKRKMSLNELSEKVDLTLSNLSILKTGKAKAVRFSTLEAICKALGCPVRYKYRSAIFETIAVLEKTKGAFKSKELERLRKNLESLVREEDQ